MHPRENLTGTGECGLWVEDLSICLPNSSDQTKHQRGMYHTERKATISNSRKVIILVPSLSNILRGVGLLRVLKLLLARIELDELVRDRPLDEDLVDIAC